MFEKTLGCRLLLRDWLSHSSAGNRVPSEAGLPCCSYVCFYALKVALVICTAYCASVSFAALVALVSLFLVVLLIIVAFKALCFCLKLQ